MRAVQREIRQPRIVGRVVARILLGALLTCSVSYAQISNTKADDKPPLPAVCCRHDFRMQFCALFGVTGDTALVIGCRAFTVPSVCGMSVVGGAVLKEPQVKEIVAYVRALSSGKKETAQASGAQNK